MPEILEPGCACPAWRQLRSDSDYVADWQAHTSHPYPSVPASFPAQEKFGLTPLFAFSPLSRCKNAEVWVIIQLNGFSFWRKTGKLWERL